MNDQKIYELMAKTPDIRAVQIADALDQELTDVSEALRALVDEGDVVRHAGTAPNGQPAQIYNLSATFKKSSEFKAIMARMPVTPAATTALSPAVTQPTDSPAPVAVKPLSHVENAIAYVRLLGKVTGTDLKRHMNIGAGSPANYLHTALRDGRLAREGSYWMLGTGMPADTTPKATSTASSRPATPAAAAATPAVTPAHAPAFRCGLWSDGVLELQRNGAPIATLTRNEGEHLTQFFNRMLTQTEAA